ncbi:hypothetical protein GCM10027614_00640 [Micromonospora vulcania]
MIASFGAKPDPSTVIGVLREPEVADSATRGWYVDPAGFPVTWTVAVTGVREDAPVAVTAYRPGRTAPDVGTEARTAPAEEAATVTVRAGVLPRTTVTCSPAANPLPVTVIASPAATVSDAAIDGWRPPRATVTVKVSVLLDSLSHAVTCTV